MAGQSGLLAQNSGNSLTFYFVFSIYGSTSPKLLPPVDGAPKWTCRNFPNCYFVIPTCPKLLPPVDGGPERICGYSPTCYFVFPTCPKLLPPVDGGPEWTCGYSPA